MKRYNVVIFIRRILAVYRKRTVAGNDYVRIVEQQGVVVRLAVKIHAIVAFQNEFHVSRRRDCRIRPMLRLIIYFRSRVYLRIFKNDLRGAVRLSGNICNAPFSGRIDRGFLRSGIYKIHAALGDIRSSLRCGICGFLPFTEKSAKNAQQQNRSSRQNCKS